MFIKNRFVFVLLFFASQSLFAFDFHDFDPYQFKLTAEEVEGKIKKYLEKDEEIRAFYRLTPQALYIGDLEQQQVDYVLLLNKFLINPSNKHKTCNSLKNARIAIDPGHFGGRFAELEERCITVSAESTENNQPIRFNEGDLTYLTALELQHLLKAEGASVLITRSGIGQGALQDDFFKWIEIHSDISKDLPLAKVFRNYYNKEDLIERAKKINEFSPDITIVVHYNSHLTDTEKTQKAVLTQSNYNLAFIPGAFGAGELQTVSNRYEFLRLIVTDHVEESLKLSELVTEQFVNHLNVPLISENEKTSYTGSSCLIQKRGIYCRNLVLTRLVHSPVCYGETLIQNNQHEVNRLAERNTSSAGMYAPKRVKEVAQAYFQGIKEYFQHKQ